MSEYVLLGIGNRMRGDDGAGSIIAEELSEIGDDDWKAVDGDVLPENYTGVIKREKPAKLFIVDVCDLNTFAGDFRCVDINTLLEDYSFNTHSAPVKLFIEYLKTFSKEIYMIGIQPKNIGMFQEVSSEVRNSINNLLQILIEKDFDKIPGYTENKL